MSAHGAAFRPCVESAARPVPPGAPGEAGRRASAARRPRAGLRLSRASGPSVETPEADPCGHRCPGGRSRRSSIQRKEARHERTRLSRARGALLGLRTGSRDHRRDRRHRSHRLVHDLRHGPPHPQGRRPGGGARHDPRPRGRRHDRRDRKRRHDAAGGGPRPRVLHHLVWPLPLLPGRPLRPLHRWRRLDPGPPDQRPPGGVRTRPVRRHLGAQAAAGDRERAGAVPRGHPPDLVRGGRAERRRPSRRHRRHRRRRPDRSRRGDDREAVHAGPDRRAGRRRRAPRARAGVRGGHRRQQRRDRSPGGDHGAHRTGSESTSPSRRSAFRTRSSSAPRSSGPAATSRTSASTAPRPLSTWRSCGSRT